MPSKEEILNYLKEIKPKLKEDGITEIGLFGSYAKGTNDIASDIDIVIKSDAKTLIKKTGSSIDAIIFLDDLRQNLEKKFKIKVDLCDTASMSEKKKGEILQGVVYA